MTQNIEKDKVSFSAFSFPHVFLGVLFVLFGFYPLAIGEFSPQAYVRAGFGVIGLASVFIGFGAQKSGARFAAFGIVLFVFIMNIVAFFTPDDVDCGYNKLTRSHFTFEQCRSDLITVSFMMDALLIFVVFCCLLMARQMRKRL